jgi:hypothetical protein
VNFGYFTDTDKKVLHWYLRPRDVPPPIGLVPDDLDDAKLDGWGDDEEDDDDDWGEDTDEGPVDEEP